MVPAQPSAEFDPDSKRDMGTNFAAGRGNATVSMNSPGKTLKYMIKTEDTLHQMEVQLDEQTKVLEHDEDVPVNLSDLTMSNDLRVPKTEDPDETECSSSFADTISGNDNCSALSDAEVESQFCGDDGFASAYDDFSGVLPMRKKKLTTHWRNFIHPLMWRCKLAELKIKEFSSQAARYDREISMQNQRKQMEQNQFTVEGFGSRSLPYTSQCHRKKAMKRRKRKRVEDTTDTKSYMSNHNLFAYQGSKKSDQEGTFIGDDLCDPVSFQEKTTSADGDFGINSDGSFLEEKDTYMEQIFQKIKIVHSRVHKMRAQLDLVLSKNAIKFSSSENLSSLVPHDAQTSSIRSPTLSACHGDTMLMGGIYDPSHLMSDYEMGDLVMPESGISSFGAAFSIPDIIESTAGLLSSVDVTQHQSQIGDSCEDILDNILIHNQVAEAERHTFTKSYNHQPTCTENHQVADRSGEEESAINPVLPTLEPNHLGNTTMPQEEQPTLKLCLASDFRFPKNKRKRGERKAGLGNWSRQCPGEPDS